MLGPGNRHEVLDPLVAPVYGLDDAPIRWHHTVLAFLLELGFERSLFEQCCLVKIMTEVDDFNIAATEEYLPELLKRLEERFVFGKWEYDTADLAVRTVTFQKCKVLMTQEKYIVEKLHQLKVPRGLLSQKDKLLCPDLFEEYRSMLFKVFWHAHQTRPEAGRHSESAVLVLECGFSS